MTSESVDITEQPPGAGMLPGVAGEAEDRRAPGWTAGVCSPGQILQDEEAMELSPAG